jgi:hypothetical protein
MRSKYLLAAAVLLPFVTMPSLANAGQTYGSHKAARMAEQRVPNAYAYYPTWDLKAAIKVGRSPTLGRAAGELSRPSSRG